MDRSNLFHEGRLLKFMVFSCVLLAGLLALEGIVRLLGLAPPLVQEYGNNVPDPYLPYKPRPNSVISGRSTTDEYDFEFRHNSFGLRDSEHAEAKPPGVIRILGLGDSFTYGAGAGFEETYLYLLEKRLNASSPRAPRFEIIKAGISRYFPEPERILLEQYGAGYHPDIVLVGFVPNDVVDTYLGIDAVVVDASGFLKRREARELGPAGLWLYKRSAVLRILLYRYLSARISAKYQVDWGEIYRENGRYEESWRAIAREYRHMGEIARSMQARLILVHIPQKGPWTEESSYPSKRLAEIASSIGAGFVDTLPLLEQAAGGRDLYYEKDGHCTPAGYAVISDAIYDHLMRDPAFRRRGSAPLRKAIPADEEPEGPAARLSRGDTL